MQEHLTDPIAFLNDISASLSEEDDGKVGDLIGSGAVLRWHRFDEDDPSTWPSAHLEHMGQEDIVLGLTVWTKGASHRWGNMASSNSRQAVFFEAHYGRYDWLYRDGERQECVFFLDHGGHDEDDQDDYVSAPKWWTFIADPQSLDLEGVG